MGSMVLGTIQLKNGDNAFLELNKTKRLDKGQPAFNTETNELKIGIGLDNPNSTWENLKSISSSQDEILITDRNIDKLS